MLALLAAIVSFPGPLTQARSPTSRARIFYREHWRDGGQEHPVFYDDGRGRITRIATVTRNMDVSWSPDGRRFFLQDNWGSNIADCYVISADGSRVKGVSLLRLIQRVAGRPRGDQRPFRAHYYVGCEGWRPGGMVAGLVTGHTDRLPIRQFDHPFIYDAERRRIRWRR